MIAALPLIFGALSAVPKLVDAGRSIYESITGNRSQAVDAGTLQEQVAALPVEQQRQWVDAMGQALEMYRAETDRLKIEQGEVNTANLTPEDAGKIAIMRQTTRPLVVRRLVHYFLFPGYLVIADLIQEVLATWLVTPWAPNFKIFHSFAYVFGNRDATAGLVEKVGQFLQAPQTTMAAMYVEGLPWVTAIVGGYMTLREVGKVMENRPAAASITTAVDAVAGLIAGMRKKGT